MYENPWKSHNSGIKFATLSTVKLKHLLKNRCKVWEIVGPQDEE